MAKKFSFRLDPVLKLRSHKVTRAKEELGRIVGLRTAKEREIEEQEEYFDKLLNPDNKKCLASELQAETNHRDFVDQEIKKLHNQKQQLEEMENLRRLKLSEAMKDEKIIEKLKEKKHTKYKSEVIREETITLDEIARGKYNKSNSI